MKIKSQFNSLVQKPEILYHASDNRKVKEFEPRALGIRDSNEGPRVFATPDKALASCFLVRYKWIKLGLFNDIHYIVIAEKDKFLETDKGGAIYSMPNTTFQTDLEKGLKDLEWTSKEPVKPVGKEEFSSGLEAMLQSEVLVYFVDLEKFNTIQQASDHGQSILRTLKSENELRGMYFKSLPTIES